MDKYSLAQRSEIRIQTDKISNIFSKWWSGNLTSEDQADYYHARLKLQNARLVLGQLEKTRLERNYAASYAAHVSKTTQEWRKQYDLERS